LKYQSIIFLQLRLLQDGFAFFRGHHRWQGGKGENT
jgi:hypothetical protein